MKKINFSTILGLLVLVFLGVLVSSARAERGGRGSIVIAPPPVNNQGSVSAP